MSDPFDRTGPNQQTLAAPTDSASMRNSQPGFGVDGSTIAAGPGIAPSQPSQPRIDPYIGTTLDGRYFIEQQLGEGGMGVVYRGRHKVIGKRVAIKILRGDMAADAEMVERFLNEARAASSIGNPHIVDISDFGRVDGATFFVMEFLEGQALAALTEHNQVIPIPRLVHIAKQIARGLAAAHARGIVHRDLKPDNVMLIPRGEDQDFVKVLDFGIAKVASESGRLTRAGSVFGTPHYMSPEQAAGVPVDQRTDIYSLGVILYEMASGKVPFDADNFMGILTQHMYKSPAPIRALVPQPQDVPPGLEAIVLKCLSKKVDLRYQSMDELAVDLERVERGMVPQAVEEMMGRSGGFNVPADYFRKQQVPGGPTMMPATPPFRQKKPILAAVLMSVGAVALLITAVVIGVSVRASPKQRAVTPEGSAALGAGAATVAPVEARTNAFLTVAPAEALVFVGDGKPQTSPLSIPLGPSEKVTVRVECKGYVSQTFAIDGRDILDPAKAIRAVTLLRDPSIAVAPPTKPPPGGRPLSGVVKPPTTAAATAPATALATTKPTTAPPVTAPATCDQVERDPFTHQCPKR
jgi:serine/threonine-protein kinase